MGMQSYGAVGFHPWCLGKLARNLWLRCIYLRSQDGTCTLPREKVPRAPYLKVGLAESVALPMYALVRIVATPCLGESAASRKVSLNTLLPGTRFTPSCLRRWPA